MDRRVLIRPAVIAGLAFFALVAGVASAQTARPDVVRLPGGGDVFAALESKPRTLLLEYGGTYKVAAPRSPVVRSDDTVIGAYGDPLKGRPQWISTNGPALSGWGGSATNLLEDVRVNDVDFSFAGKPNAHGLHWLDVGNLHMERVSVTGFDFGISVQGFKGRSANVRLIDSVVADNWPAFYKHCSGIYASNTDGLAIVDCVFDANGYRTGVVKATIYNHDVYVHGSCTNVLTRGNVFARAASHGLQQRPGGTSEGNFFYRNPIGQSFGLVNGSTAFAGGVTGRITGNVYVGGGDIAGSKRGYTLELGNVRGPVAVEDLLVLDDTSRNAAAILLEVCRRLDNPEAAVGILDVAAGVPGLTFRDVRVTRSWAKGPLRRTEDLVPGDGRGKIGTATHKTLGTPDAFVSDVVPVWIHRKVEGITVPPREVADVDAVIGRDFLERARKQPKGAAGRAIAALRIAAGVDVPVTPPPPPPPPPAGKLEAVRMYDADADAPITGPIAGEWGFDLQALPTRNLNFVAETSGRIGSVRITYGQVSRIEHTPPYAVGGDNGGDFLGFTPAVGTETLTAEAFSGTNATGASLGRVEARVTVTDGPPPDPNAEVKALIARLEQELVAARAMAAEAAARVLAIEREIVVAQGQLK